MLYPMASSFAISPPNPTIRLHEVPWWIRQIVVPALQLFQVLRINEMLLPQMVKELEIRTTRTQGMSEHGVAVREMLHAQVPSVMAVITRRGPVT